MKIQAGVALSALLAALVLLAWSSGARAHTHLEKSVPANGAVLNAAPENIVLTFAEPARLTALSLRKNSEPAQKLAPLPSATARELTVALPRLTPGKYVVSWRVLSEDGHVMPGDLSFTIAAQ
ncbi:MAG TPA: copper resistance CopC family protein [Steroidobacteraceae bacterium]|nr:copper resistance CopC family protein [Steroidobacteraceae bacterium]